MEPPGAAGTPGPRVQLLLLLCWTLVTCPPGAMALQPPSITALRTPARTPRLGESVKVSCEAASGFPEFTLLYWLANGSFVEKLHPDGAVREGTVLEEPRGSVVTLQRELLFDSFATRDLRTNFTCVVLSPFGVATREVRWPPPAPATRSRGLG
ncbi:interleukin-18-binding protein [Phaenicophaeus curvirostris]|uniref:interleukin-18-binding protein n=1 Tax=Phaenicophaeus curvirostris TaxID=33595 RepID=UPI0037F0C43F